MEGNKKQRTWGAVISYISVAVSIITGFFSVSLLTHFLGQSEYGVYSLVSSLVGYISIMDFGIHNVTVRYIAIYRADGEKKKQEKFVGLTLKLYFAIDIIVAGAGLVLYKAIPYFFASNMTLSEIQLAQELFGVLLINLLISLPGAIFAANITAYEQFIFDKTLQVIKLLSKLVLIFLVLRLGGKSLSLVWLDTALNIFVLIVEGIYCYKKLGFEVDFKSDSESKQLFKNVVRFTSFVFLASISDQINWKIDGLILGTMCGSAAVAVSSVGMQLVSVYRSITAVIPGVFLPRIAQMVTDKSDTEELTDVMIKIGRIQLFLIGLMLCGFMTIGKQFIMLWVGDSYHDAYWIFMIIALALIIPSTQSIGINILEAKNMHGFRAKVYACISIGNLVVTVFLVKIMGIVGSAIGTAIALIIGNVFVINWYYWKVIKLNISRFFQMVFGRLFPSIIVSCVVCIFCMHFICTKVDQQWLQLGLGGIAVILIYFVIVLSIGTSRDLKLSILDFFKEGNKLHEHH